MTTNLFVKMSSQPLMIVRSHDVAASEIHAAQLQQMMMAEVLAGDQDSYPDTIVSWLDNSRQFEVSAAVALLPLWIFSLNYNAYQTLDTQSLKFFANNCEAMFYGEKFFYDDSCGIDAGAGSANGPRELLSRCILFNQYQCDAGFTAEDIQRFFDAGVISEDDRDDMLDDLAEVK